METTRIGWIGTGVMGRSMAGHLLAAGFPLTVTTRTRAKAEPLLAAGARWAETPRALAEQSDVVCSIVGMPSDVEQVHLGPDGTLAAGTLPKLVIDLTTSSPALARRIADAARAKGVGALDAPVSGGDLGARNATLSIMCGGSQPDFALAEPILSKIGKTVVLQGAPGAGQHT
jgi:3-hydroxyisobutyrate dehydrogenase